MTGQMEARFWSKVAKGGPGCCWLWTASHSGAGYGAFKVDGKMRRAHRVAWLITTGAWPEQVIDHLCRVPACVNPAHLEDVTPRENALRGETIPAAHAAKTHCPSGHPYAGANLARRNGRRFCMACRVAYNRGVTRRRTERRRAERIAAGSR